MLVVGDKETENGTVSVRRRGEDKELGSMPLEEFKEKILGEINSKAL